LLAGKYRRDQPSVKGTRFSMGWDEPPVRDWDQLWDIVDALVETAEEHGASPAQVSLRWVLDKPGVTSVVIGARTDAQLVDNLGVVDLRLTDAERARLDELSRPPLLYPYWHQARNEPDRLGSADLSLLEPYLE
jgi:aryl-alcohol dehydrogenase-like predicted oxidoreductase